MAVTSTLAINSPIFLIFIPFLYSTNTFSFNFSFLSEGTYWIKVVATDGINTGINVSKFSIVNASFAINIISPSENEVVKGIINISGTAHVRNREIKKVEIKIDDGEWQTANGTENWFFTLDTSSLKNGKHLISARAYDGENYSHIISITIDVENKKRIPGFEMVMMIGAVMIMFYMKKKKR